MKRFLPMLLAFLMGALIAAAATSPDQHYVEILGLIEEGDQLQDSAQSQAAAARYVEAQAALVKLQSSHPGWNTDVIEYRLKSLTRKLDTLGRKPAPGSPALAEISLGQPLTNQLRAMSEEVARLTAQNSLLAAKLREALTVQPASIDPRELAKAEERIKQLQKERDLLSVTLEQRKVEPAGPPDQAATQREVDQARQQLATQSATLSVLQQQNENLRKQLAEQADGLKNAAPPSAAPDPGLDVRETIAMLQASNRVLQTEQTLMEQQLADWVRRFGAEASAREKALTLAQQERDENLQKLNEVLRELNQRSSKAPSVSPAAASALEKQLDVLRARLAVFEAKQVPYTTEELRLFQQPKPRLARAETNAPPATAAATSTNAATAAKKGPRDLPPGAGPLIAAAQRAIETERFADAEKKYQEVLRQDENNVFVLANLAAVQMDQDKLVEAEQSLTRALAVDGQDSASLYMMGNLKLRQEKYDEAIEKLSRSAQLDPDKAQTQFSLGKALIQKGSREPAETALRKAVQLKPGWGDPHYLLSVLYSTQQPPYPELSQYHYRKAIAGGAPRNPDFERWMENKAGPAPRP